jgi:hypothetical protein
LTLDVAVSAVQHVVLVLFLVPSLPYLLISALASSYFLSVFEGFTTYSLASQTTRTEASIDPLYAETAGSGEKREGGGRKGRAETES